jgi:hypothetical protein
MVTFPTSAPFAAFGESATYQDGEVDEASITIIYNREPVLEVVGDSEQRNYETTAEVKTAELPSPAINKTITARSVVYYITDIEVDGDTGITKFYLSRNNVSS